MALSVPVLQLPLIPSLPDHPPEAVQLVAFVEDQLKVEADPLVTVPGLAVRATVGLTAAAFTVIVKLGNAADAAPSLTLIAMPGSVPTSAAAGVPLSCPVAALKLAHEGKLVMENVRGLPEGSLTVGVKEYAIPTVTLAPGVPEIVGGDGFGPVD